MGLKITNRIAIPLKIVPEKQHPNQIKQSLNQTKTVLQGNSPVKQDVPVKTGKNLASLLSSLKLPQDSLSQSIITIARFFSLPLEPKLLNALRREVLEQAKSGKPIREAPVLGAAAAADKGIKLGEKVLAEYCAAIEGSIKCFKKDSSSQTGRPQTSEGQIKDRENQEHGQGNQETGTKADSGSRQDTKFRDESRTTEPKHFWNKAQDLQKKIEEILEERPLLDFINRIPGKNKQWIVVPFSFIEHDLEITVSLRILLNKNHVLTAGINVSRPGQNPRNWLITVENINGQPTLLPESHAELGFFPEPERYTHSNKIKMVKDLAKILGLPLKNVQINDRVSLFDDLKKDIFCPIDEEV
ncbi:MAG: hypothetical protein LBH07_08355 [Treponema sp.]|jgi:hypothetical protein|nr:hypothetical protein [Treponema sp.]